jgi:signal peptide peptidase SppA
MDRANDPVQLPLALEVLSEERPWAITPRAIKGLIRAARHPDLEAVAARVGQPVDNGNRDVENHNGTAVVNIRGPLFRYRSIFTWLLGGSSVEETSLALHAAVDDPSVKRVVLAINSPGGQIDGINELANMIHAADQVKPVVAYVDGLAASGAYWLASAARKIVADETAQLGSIGVLATVTDESEAEERKGIKRYDVISSQSPYKRSDPATDAGREQLQQMVDAMAQVFIGKVAEFRNTSEERVKRDFGGGGVLAARSAVAVGMADSLGSLQGLLDMPMRNTDNNNMPMDNDNMPMRRNNMPDNQQMMPGPMDGPIRRMKDEPGKRVSAQVANPFDEEELEEETDDEKINDDSSCTCPPGENSCACGSEEDEEDDEKKDDDDEEDDDESDESEGTEQKPDKSSIPKGEDDLIKPSEERQRIAAILTCEEARGREDLARMLALETNHSVESAQKILSKAPAPAPAQKPNALEAHMGQITNPVVGTPGDAAHDDSPAAEVQRILAFVPKNRQRIQVQ